MMDVRPVATMFLALAVTACGNSSPAAPTPVAPATPTVSSLRIDGIDALRTGFFSDYTATATLSNGTTQAVTPTWASSNSSLASVDGNGRLSGHNHGGITLTATHQGVATTKNISIVTNYGGQWAGSFVMRKCDQSGVFAAVRYCQTLGPIGTTFQMTLSLSQAGNDRAQISGTINFGGILTGPVSGNVTGDGRLVIGSNFTVSTQGITFTFQVGGWESRLSGTSGMTGRWADNLTAIGTAGNAYTENELLTLTRTSVADVAPVNTPQTIHLDWREYFAARRGR